MVLWASGRLTTSLSSRAAWDEWSVEPSIQLVDPPRVTPFECGNLYLETVPLWQRERRCGEFGARAFRHPVSVERMLEFVPGCVRDVPEVGVFAACQGTGRGRGRWRGRWRGGKGGGVGRGWRC